MSAARQRRSLAVYAAVWLAGLVALLTASTPGLQVFSVGLWLPGAGFLALGGWAILLFPLTIAFLGVAVFAWFGAGMLLAPIVVWLGSALIAMEMASGPIWRGGPVAALLVMAATGMLAVRRARQREANDNAAFVRKSAAIGPALDQAWARAAPAATQAERELTPEDLKGLRYLLDRALQPVDQFGGFELIDIFQTASVRYQINLAGYALSVTHAQNMPNFQGYMATAQRNLIEKYLHPKVWIYWPLETSWGHFNFTNWDPAGKDNIMLTGYFGAQVALYSGNTQDKHYEQPGSLTFRLTDRLRWQHDVHSITKSVFDNMSASAFCLYACEPNWVYPACNFKGMTTLAAHDRVYGTDYVERIRPSFMKGLDREFTDAAGGIIGLRSSLTGFTFPFPTGDAGFAVPCNAFDPDRAWRLWALAAAGLRQAIVEKDGKRLLMLPNKGIDFGNYRRGNLTLALGSLLNAAGEFGDVELQGVIRDTLAVRGGRVETDGVVRYSGGSNTANIYAVSGGYMRRDDFRRTFTEGPPPTAFTGPYLAGADYPAVLVASAFSDGEDLNMVLYPGKGDARQTITMERLVPEQRYIVQGRSDLNVIADANGRASLALTLVGRTHLHLQRANT